MKINYDTQKDILIIKFAGTEPCAEIQTEQGHTVQLDAQDTVVSVNVPNFMQLVTQGEIDISGIEPESSRG